MDYARYVLDADLRYEKLHSLIRWKIGIAHGENTDVGIFGRWFRRYLPESTWEQYLETYSGAEPEDQWRAMFAMCELVGEIGGEVAGHYGFDYPSETDAQATDYLRRLYADR